MLNETIKIAIQGISHDGDVGCFTIQEVLVSQYKGLIRDWLLDAISDAYKDKNGEVEIYSWFEEFNYYTDNGDGVMLPYFDKGLYIDEAFKMYLTQEEIDEVVKEYTTTTGVAA